jgi:hypothetical protein
MAERAITCKARWFQIAIAEMSATLGATSSEIRTMKAH